jgi:hypothetical protein
VRHEARQADERLHAPCIWGNNKAVNTRSAKSFSRQVVKVSIVERIELVWILTEAYCHVEVLGGLDYVLRECQ